MQATNGSLLSRNSWGRLMAFAIAFSQLLPREARSQRPVTSADTSAILADAIPFLPLINSSALSVGWPSGAMYEGMIRVPVSLWSRTRSIREMRDRVSQSRTSHCAPSRSPLWLYRAIKRQLGSDRQSVGGSPVNSAAASSTSVPIDDARSDSTSIARAPVDTASGCSVVFTPAFVLRQLAGSSAPVRSPSFNPQITFNHYFLRFYEDSTVRSRETILEGDNATMAAVQLSIGHYSNGQSGCLFQSQTYDDKTEKCLGEGGLGSLNTEDGSFSTHYLEYGGTFASMKFDADLVETRRFSSTLLTRWNPAFLAPLGGMDDELARLYGRWNFQLGLALKQQGVLEGMRYTLHSSFDFDCSTRKVLPCRGQAQAGLSFPALYGFGFFAKAVGGSDYYNTGFANRLSNGRRIGPINGPIFGVMIDHTRLVTLSTRGAVKRVETRGR